MPYTCITTGEYKARLYSPGTVSAYNILKWGTLFHDCYGMISWHRQTMPMLAWLITQVWIRLSSWVINHSRVQLLDLFYKCTLQLWWWVTESNIASMFVDMNRHVLKIHGVCQFINCHKWLCGCTKQYCISSAIISVTKLNHKRKATIV